MFAIDFVMYNPNYQKYVYNSIVFQIDGSGYVTPATTTNVITAINNKYRVCI